MKNSENPLIIHQHPKLRVKLTHSDSDGVEDDEERVPAPSEHGGRRPQEAVRVERVADDLRDAPREQEHRHRGRVLYLKHEQMNSNRFKINIKIRSEILHFDTT